MMKTKLNYLRSEDLVDHLLAHHCSFLTVYVNVNYLKYVLIKLIKIQYVIAFVFLCLCNIQVEEAQKRLNKWDDTKKEPLLVGVTDDN